ncbi:MAG: hypothetical protein AAF202_05515, partial [Pseudomonadota bacterium]
GGDGSSGGNSGAGALGKLTASECGESKKEILNLAQLIERVNGLDADPAKVYYREMFAFPISTVDQIPDIQSEESVDGVFTAHFLNENRLLGLDPARLSQLIQRHSAFRVQPGGTGATADCTKIRIRFLPNFIGFASIRAGETGVANQQGDTLDEMRAMLEELSRERDGEVIDEDEAIETILEDAVTEETVGSEKIVNFEVNLELSTRDRLVLKAENQDFWMVYSVNKRRDEEEITVRVMLPSEVPSCTGGGTSPYVLEYVQVLSWNNNVVRLSKSYLSKIEGHLSDAQDLDDIDEDGETVDIGLNTAVILNGKTAEDRAVTCPTAPTTENDPAANTQDIIVEDEE